MDIERNKEIKEVNGSTFVEKYEVEAPVEEGSKGPEVSFEQEGAEKEIESRVERKKTAEKSTLQKEKGLGYENEDVDENVNEISDYSSANMWRKALKDKKAA